jgi:hypothetical protein
MEVDMSIRVGCHNELAHRPKVWGYKGISIILFTFLALSSNPLEVLASDWPKLNGGTHDQCAEAFQIATTAFKSDEFYLYEPPEIPADFGSVLVLKPEAGAISGGTLQADPIVFDKFEEGPWSVYWQKTAIYGYRLVVKGRSVGWLGHTSYALFAVGETIQADEFLAGIKKNKEDSKFAVIASDSWRPPLIFRERNSGRYWIIEVPDGFLGDWRVHVVEPEGIKLHCVVQFKPNVENAVSLLPQPVRELERLLDESMGEDEGSGSYHPIGMLRNEVVHTWANAAQRPWALRATYNTREEVDAGLSSWSRQNATHGEIYRDIVRQYPLAEQSLTEYYQTNFSRSADEAKSLASCVLDIVFRSHYAFHSDDPNAYFRDSNSRPNPWQTEWQR